MSFYSINNLSTDCILDNDEIRETAFSIIAMQTESGGIPKTIDGQIDPWNHLEAAMALTAAGYFHEAKKSILWLADMQNRGGFWYSAYNCQNETLDYTIDTNQCVYIAVAVLHYYLFTDDGDFLAKLWPTVIRATDFVASMQRESGSIPWSIQANEFSDEGDTSFNPQNRASLFAASCSVYHSFKAVSRLLCILEQAFALREEFVGNIEVSIHDIRSMKERLTFALSALQKSLTGYIQNDASVYFGEYLDKNFYAMEYYYPLMTGLISQETIDRAAAAEDIFILEDWGARCLLEHDWFTTAETAEWAIAKACTGNIGYGESLLRSTYRHRLEDGSYLTGSVYPSAASFPDGERSSYSAAAVILANDVISGGITKDIFTLSY